MKKSTLVVLAVSAPVVITALYYVYFTLATFLMSFAGTLSNRSSKARNSLQGE